MIYNKQSVQLIFSSSSGIDVKEINEQIIKDMETSEKMPEEMREKLLQYGRGDKHLHIVFYFFF